MFRREALRRFAAVGVAATLAGCGSAASDVGDGPQAPTPPGGSGPAVESESALRVSAIDYREGDAGSLVVVVEVANRDDRSRSGTLRATVRIDGEQAVETVEVTVAADDFETVEVPFGVAFDDFEQDGGIDLEIE